MKKVNSMEHTPSKVLITGSQGFIFSHVTEYFLKKGWTVVGVDDLSTGSHPELLEYFKTLGDFKFHQQDCAELSFQDLVIRESPDYIVHAASISDVDFSIKDPEYVLRQNVLGMINVFEGARHVQNLKKLLYVSTDEVYGECDTRKSEADIIFPKNPYAASKAFGSLLRLAYDNTYETMKDKTCETRFCNVFGPRQDARKVLPRILQSIRNSEQMPVQNGGKGYREYIYVKNIPPVIDMLLHSGDRTYNVTLGDGFTVEELIGKVEEVSGSKVETTEAHRPGMDMKYQMDNARIMSLGYVPLYTFDEGLAEYIRETL